MSEFLQDLKNSQKSKGGRIAFPESTATPTIRGSRPAPSFDVMKKQYGHTPETARQYNNAYAQWTKDVVEAAKITEDARERLKKGEVDGGLEL